MHMCLIYLYKLHKCKAKAAALPTRSGPICAHKSRGYVEDYVLQVNNTFL